VLAVHVNNTECETLATPVPDSVIVAGEPVALLTTVIAPIKLPAVVGENSTPKVRLCEGASVTGVLAPLSAKLEPVKDICDIVTLELPAFDRETLWVDEPPSLTLPKLKLLVLNESVCVDAIPAPLRAIALGEFGALLIIDALPETEPAEVGENCRLNVLDCPAPKTMGKFREPVPNPLPATLTCEIVSVPVPLLLTCIVCELVAPVDRLPKLTVAGVTESIGCTALPLRGTTVLVPCELETETLPVTVSELAGVNVKVIAAFCPALSVSGIVIPLTFTSFALTLTWEMVTAEFPLLVKVTFCDAELPALMLPKLTLAGLGVIVTDAATPVPAKLTAVGEVGALLAMLSPPGKDPAVFGANKTLTDVFLPGASVAGVFNPDKVYAAPLTESCAMVSAAVPVLVKIMACDLVCPSTTLPKSNVEGVTLSPA
jgi:hypothetical protein